MVGVGSEFSLQGRLLGPGPCGGLWSRHVWGSPVSISCADQELHRVAGDVLAPSPVSLGSD